MYKMTSSINTRYQNFCEYMEQNTRGVEVGIYAVSGILFAVANYKIRPFKKFIKPSDIPTRFIRQKIVQKGKVKTVEPNQITGPVLKVEHQPPIELFFASNKTLPVKIFGVELNANGFSWLQSVTVNQKVEFLPLACNANNALCQVKMLQDPLKHNKPSIDLAESLISLGFAKVEDGKSLIALSRDEQLKRYHEKLQKIQSVAKKNRNGIWSSIPPPIWPLNVIQKRINQAIYHKVLPAKHRLPELVR